MILEPQWNRVPLRIDNVLANYCVVLTPEA